MSEFVLDEGGRVVFPKIFTSIRPEPAVRILAPTGALGTVPEEKLDAALEAGAVVMSPEKMREMRQAIFMEHGIFKDRNKKTVAPRHRRKSLWKQRGR